MTLTRRRFLSLASAACLAAQSAQAFRWQGVALGARAQIVLDHPRAREITRRALAEIDRLENVFSLYRLQSEISVLNAKGRLDAPTFEFLDCLATARHVHRATGGRFDPTVQPLWRVLAEAHAAGHAPETATLAAARAAVGFGRVRFDSGAIVLAPGQALTLNGIAQGYIADRVARLMRAEGVADVLIDTGEIVALGVREGHDGWPVTILGTERSRTLNDRAIATSAVFGTVLDATGQVGHIVDPRTGDTAPASARLVSVSAPLASLADALSTGLCLAESEQAARRMMTSLGDARLEHFENQL